MKYDLKIFLPVLLGAAGSAVALIYPSGFAAFCRGVGFPL